MHSPTTDPRRGTNNKQGKQSRASVIRPGTPPIPRSRDPPPLHFSPFFVPFALGAGGAREPTRRMRLRLRQRAKSTKRFCGGDGIQFITPACHATSGGCVAYGNTTSSYPFTRREVRGPRRCVAHAVHARGFSTPIHLRNFYSLGQMAAVERKVKTRPGRAGRK